MSGSFPRALARSAAALLLLAAATPAALAQSRNVPNALQGFATNRDQPISIAADSLEVLDQTKKAIFSGNVVVQQGDTTMRSKELVVFYDGKGAAPAAGAKPAAAAAPATGEALAAGSPMSSSSIRRLEINGSVVVTTKEQTATGDQGVFETASNTITLSGNPVVLSQGPNVIRGRRLTVDLASGTSRFEGGRVESLIVPNSVKQLDNAAPKPGAAPSGTTGAKPAPKPQ
ncbi:organic solvent tolerance protein OstA [Ancylobacter sp. VKM B-3255]|uniref:Organic solvent tolerance protein OstA n=2 Tax=Ancylobacter radicis TaxID=2836179 RepID=A0ABS5R5Y5_9HYPH|nr:organic solvent tolerance protein OstA [Ancylobacter radicis]